MNRTSAAVAKLKQLTDSNKLKWYEYLGKFIRPEQILGKVYEASYQGKRLALYETRYKYYTDEDTWEWATRTNIEIIDPAGDLEWAWPQTQEADELLETVRFKLSGAQDLLDNLIMSPLVEEE